MVGMMKLLNCRRKVKTPDKTLYSCGSNSPRNTHSKGPIPENQHFTEVTTGIV